jgi:hypothetical protein
MGDGGGGCIQESRHLIACILLHIELRITIALKLNIIKAVTVTQYRVNVLN